MQDMETKMTKAELQTRQKWTLEQKIDHSLGVIDQFVSHCDGKVFCSWSGGKDSTVLLDLCRVIKPDILAVFCNSGNDWPEIIQFVNAAVKRGENIKVLRPKMTPRQIWERYGFPLPSKEVAGHIRVIRKNPDGKTARRCLDDDNAFRLAYRYRYLLNEPYDVSDQCCHKIKKEPMNKFIYQSGLSPIIGTMASESMMRETAYIRNGGCNVFKDISLKTKQLTGGGRYTHSASYPLSIWTEDDVWEYIRRRGLPIAEIYHKGAARTGCVGCAFGCLQRGDSRFDLLYSLYPKYYKMIMNYTNNGITYREAVRKLLTLVGKTLPDENLLSL